METPSTADEQFPGAHAPDCTCSTCIENRKRLKREKRAKAQAQKKEARKKNIAAALAVFGKKASGVWEVIIGIGTAATSVFTLLAAISVVATMIQALWRALETGGNQWIVALCCVPALLVIIWMNQHLGAE